MKNTKKIMALFLTICLLIPSIHVINAEENKNSLNHFKINEKIIEDDIFIEDGTISEKITYIENSIIITSERITKKDGTYIIKKIIGNQETIVSSGITDYNELFNYLFAKTMVPYGSDITNPNFKHVYLGSPGTRTYYRSDFNNLSDAAAIAGTIVGLISLPWGAALQIASVLLDGGGMPYKFTVTTKSYQIHFVYDNSYYTHCYHQTVKEYNESGKLTKSYTDYYQSVGG